MSRLPTPEPIPYRCSAPYSEDQPCGHCPGCLNLEALETECAAIEHHDAGYVPIFEPKKRLSVAEHLKTVTRERVWGKLAK